MDSMDVPAWSYKMIEMINLGDYAEFVLVIKNKTQQKKRGFWLRIRQNWRHQMYLLFRQIEEKIVKVEPDAFEKKDVKELLSGIPILEVIPQSKIYSDYFTEEDLEKIRKCDLDVLIRMGFRILRGEILRLPKYGIWSFHHGDNDTVRGGPAGVWEVINNHSITGSILQILTEDLDNGIVLQRCYTASDLLSIKRNRNKIYWMNVSTLPNKLRELYRGGEDLFNSEVEELNFGLNFYSHPLYKTPKNWVFIRFLIRYFFRWVKFKFNLMFFKKDWFLLYRYSENISTSLWRFKRLHPPKGRIWADPFVIAKNDCYYVFIEESFSAKKQGHISYLIMDAAGHWSEPQIIIDRPYHLSYPYIFEFEESYYILISNGVRRTIEIFKCLSFPGKWEFQTTLMRNVNAVDASIYFDQNKWWMFMNIKENEGASTWDSLFLFYSDYPLGENWIAHPKNPIVTDVRKARPAGQIFAQEGVVYRPAQDCSKGYGHGIRLNQIDILNETEYEEHEVSSIIPNWDKNLKGVHTINYSGGLTLVDGKRYIPKF